MKIQSNILVISRSRLWAKREMILPIPLRDPLFDAATLGMRLSSKGNYLSLTATVNATSREQLDNLYRALSSHPMVKVVL